MESEKVKEIKEKLQEEIFIANSFGDKLRKVPTKELENLLTLINELESENERLLEQRNKTYNIWVKDTEKLKDRIAELEKENARLDNVAKHFQELIEDGKLISSEELKQFAERLKELKD